MDTATLKSALGNGATGTYVLCLQLNKAITLSIGKLGKFKFEPGCYYYVGSAFGPGGIAARCMHHLRISENPRWHIDYLRAQCLLTDIYFGTDKKHLECNWSKKFTHQKNCSAPIKNFGASDCDCFSHLFYSVKKLAPEKFINKVSCLRP